MSDWEGGRSRTGTTGSYSHNPLQSVNWGVLALTVLLAALLAVACGEGPEPATTSRNRATADAAKSDSPKVEFLQIAARLANSANPYLGTLQVPRMRQQLAASNLTVRLRCRLHADLSSHLLRLGETEAAIAEIEAAISVAGSQAGLEPTIWAILHHRRAVAYLRQAENSNCVLARPHNRDTCLFPLAGGGIHADKSGAREARRSLLAALEHFPERRSFFWLLNIATMAIGDYPDGVPQAYRIPPSAFESAYDIGRFVDIAHELGVDTFNQCGGAIVEDFDGDGFLDIVTSTFDPAGPLTYYRSLGDGHFEDRSAASHLDQQLGGLNCVGADYDNDGDTDILVLRGAWLFDDGRIRNSLVRNNGDGTFTDVTRHAGLAEPARPTQAAVWGDFDADGHLDLFIGNESRLETPAGDGDYPSQLFLNNGDGTFTDVAQNASVTNDRYCKAATAGDYDNDGDLDLYASNVGKNRLYRNNGDGTLTDVAKELAVMAPESRSFVPWFFDFDNDGWLDLFVGAFDASIGDIAADYLGEDHDGISPRLYRNDGGEFTDIAREAGLDHPYLPMGANFGDLDNDGYLDIYLTTGDPEYQTLTPNIMLRNDSGRRYQDVTTSGGFGHLQKGHGVGFADIDNDGDQDIYHQLGGFYPGDGFHNALFQNPGHGNHFLVVKLTGVATNRAGYGARIRVTISTPEGGLATFHRAVGSVSSFGGSPARQEIGLGKATGIERVEVDWPISQTTAVITGVPLDSMIGITEGKPGFELLPYRTLTLKIERPPARPSVR